MAALFGKDEVGIVSDASFIDNGTLLIEYFVYNTVTLQTAKVCRAFSNTSSIEHELARNPTVETILTMKAEAMLTGEDEPCAYSPMFLPADLPKSKP